VKELDTLKQTLQTGTDDLVVLKSTLDAVVAGIEGVEVTDVEKIVSPVNTNVKSVAAKKTHLGYLFPTFIILIVMFMSLLFSTTVTMKEKLSKAFFRNFIMPTSDFLFMVGGYITNILIVAFQMAILFIAAIYFLPELRSVILTMAVIILIVATVFILLGMFIGFVFKSEETATLGAISIGSLMLFFSNAILPIETLPVGIRDIAKFNPFVLSVNVLKRIMLFGANFTSSFESISLEVYMLLCFVVIFFVLAFVAREIVKSRLR
ncbi:MAG: ABC transporter permease, partial [Nanoarchaeota archaeon]|nr:ABC transporter permease [Nanoarchaeota archaeon]